MEQQGESTAQTSPPVSVRPAAQANQPQGILARSAIEVHQPDLHVDAAMVPRISPPNMNDTNIESYFLSLEFWFAATGVTHDARKYNLVMAQVPPSKLMELKAIIDSTPSINRYDYIKSKLIAQFADSQQRRVQRVLSDMPLGDLKPSQLFNEMRRVAGTALCETVIIDLWASRLPPHAQAAVIASKGDVADKVAIADAIADSMNFRQINMVGNQATAAGTPTQTNNESTTLEELKKEIAQLTRQIESIKTHRSRSRSQSRPRQIRNTRQDCAQPNELCWYHHKFGANARTCRKPCSYNNRQKSE
ncbi:uncharacterized protein LOC126765583 [Bactrocera neohumeralis]|uniref:uncharacterized protein LOC126765583 n=1 Tax=Bactrocera neohumeralis TaxID=98809 RepID=UPI0021669C19|nr:uncharacterized protein LOC126765583 [Bactrocera neohumeralis]